MKKKVLAGLTGVAGFIAFNIGKIVGGSETRRALRYGVKRLNNLGVVNEMYDAVVDVFCKKAFNEDGEVFKIDLIRVMDESINEVVYK